ncbi:MAG: replication initiation protein [Thiolinea sp.]
MSDKELLAILQRAQGNTQKKSKNPNQSADDDPLHNLIDNAVTKSNALARAYYRFSLVEKRVMEALISKLHPMRTDNQLQDLELTAGDYLKAFPDAGHHAYGHLAKAGHQLGRKTITTRPETNTGEYDDYPLMAHVKYKPKEGKILYTFNPKIVPHLIGLREKFSSYPLKQAVNFKSSYTWRFYEILVSWAQPKNKIQGRFAGWIKAHPVDELRDMLGVPESYKWSDFQRQVLDVVVAELREKARVVVFIERVKTSRKITHLNINFIEDEQIPMHLEN